jgi:hypothetical protein
VQSDQRQGTDGDAERRGRAEAPRRGVLGEERPDEPERVQQQQAIDARGDRLP